jgi:hypothetical protein
MAFLTIAGTDIEVVDGECTMREVEIGTRTRMFDGTLRASIIGFKREWTLVPLRMSRTAYEALRTTCGYGQSTVTMTGDVIGGASIFVNVEFGDVAFFGENLTHRRAPQMIIREL